MSERFLKFIPSKEALHLARKHRSAFILLMFIAERARRVSGDPDGLTIGQCHIGDWESMGFSRQEYRTALRVLIVKKFIEITETCRTRQKSTTGSTTVGTLVRLCGSRVYDINPESDNHRINHCPTTDQPPTNHEQEGIRRNKKEERKEEIPHTPFSKPPSKIKFRELVELTRAEYDSLLAKHGQDFLDKLLDKLNSAKGSKGYTYKSDFFTMKEGGWVVNQVRKDLQEEQKSYNEKNYRTAAERQSIGNIQTSTAKFNPGRILRGGNEGSVEERIINE